MERDRALRRALLLLFLLCCTRDQPCLPNGMCPLGNWGLGLDCVDGQCIALYECIPGAGVFREVSCPVPEGDPSRTRCTVVLRGSRAGAACVAPRGSGTDGSPCHFTLAAGGPPIPSTEDPDCAPGYLCYAPFYAAREPGRCRKFCGDNADCPAGEACIGAFGLDPRGTGVCHPRCDPLGAPCPEGLACILTSKWFFESPVFPPAICGRPGTAQVECSADLYLGSPLHQRFQLCTAGLQCTFDPRDPSKPTSCRLLCRAQSECPSGTTCQRQEKLPCTDYPYCVCL